jgi:hypothetical protein
MLLTANLKVSLMRYALESCVLCARAQLRCAVCSLEPQGPPNSAPLFRVSIKANERTIFFIKACAWSHGIERRYVSIVVCAGESRLSHARAECVNLYQSFCYYIQRLHSYFPGNGLGTALIQSDRSTNILFRTSKNAKWVQYNPMKCNQASPFESCSPTRRPTMAYSHLRMDSDGGKWMDTQRSIVRRQFS